MVGSEWLAICEVGTGIAPGSTLKCENGKFLDIEGLNNLDGESGGGGTRMLLIILDRKAAFAGDVGGARGS